MKMAGCQSANSGRGVSGSKPNRTATWGVHSHASVSRSHSNQPIPPATCAIRNRSSVAVSRFSIRASQDLFSLMPCLTRASGENCLCFGHRSHFAERDMPRKMIEAAGARDDRLVRGKPRMGGDAFGDPLGSLNIGGLDINRPDAKLFISKNALE